MNVWPYIYYRKETVSINTLESPKAFSFDETPVRDLQFDTSVLQTEVGSSNDLISRLSDVTIPILEEAGPLTALVFVNSEDYKHLIGEDMLVDEDNRID